MGNSCQKKKVSSVEDGTTPKDRDSEDNDLEQVNLTDLNLDLFFLCKKFGRRATFVQLSERMIAPFLPFIKTQEKQNLALNNALNQIFTQGYLSENILYHNDMHAFDVAQMTYILLTGDDGLIV